MDSVSKIELKISIDNIYEIKSNLYKHLSPITVNTIITNLPIENRIYKFESKFVYILTQIDTNREKMRKEFKIGDIAFWPNNKAICFFITDCNITSPMNYIGKIDEDIELVNKLENGKTLKLKK